MLIKQKWRIKPPRDRPNSALLTLSFLNVNEKWTTAAERLCVIEKPVELNQPIYYKDVLTSERNPRISCIGDMDLFIFL